MKHHQRTEGEAMRKGDSRASVDLTWLPRDIAQAWQYQLADLTSLDAMLEALSGRHAPHVDGLGADISAIRVELRRTLEIARRVTVNMTDLARAIDRRAGTEQAHH